jgi:hypothetical protein
MPLRDHFRPPVDERHSWDEVHGQWPAMIVQQLFPLLPDGYEAAPRVHPQNEYEVRVYDARRGRRLVAAIELVSPGNKDRQEHRAAFVAKCLALLQQQVSVSIVDVVTVRHFNLYAELLRQIGHEDPGFGNTPPPIYAVTCRTHAGNAVNLLDAWNYPLVLGQALPLLPMWLAEDLTIPLNLEASYEETCRLLRIA